MHRPTPTSILKFNQEETMQYTTTYHSPLGEILLAADEIGLTGLWFDGEKYYAWNLDENHEEK